MFARILACLPAALVISALAIPAHATEATSKGWVEPLIGMVYDYDGVTFQVRSGGCTSKDNFKFNIIRDSQPVMVTLERVVPDVCEAVVPNGVQLHYTYAEIAVAPSQQIAIQNPVNPGIAIQKCTEACAK